MCPRLSANYVSCCPPNMAQVSVWAGNLHPSGIQPSRIAQAILSTHKLRIDRLDRAKGPLTGSLFLL